MIQIFKKIWDFAGKEQRNIKKSVVLGFFYAIFHMLQIGALFFTIQELISDHPNKKMVRVILGFFAVSLIGKIAMNLHSQLEQTHAGYFMAANKRLFIGNKMKMIPMGFYNDSSLGNITGICTTVLGDVETTAPMVMVLTLSGFITTLVFTVYMLIFDWRMGLIATVAVVLYCIALSALEKKSRAMAPKRQLAQTKLVENVLETIQGMAVVKSFNLTKRDGKQIDQAIKESKTKNLGMEKILTPYTILQGCILRIFSVIMMGAAVWLYLKGTLGLAYTFMFMIISFIVFEQIESAGHGIAILRVCGSSIEQANEMDSVPVMDSNGKNIIPKNHEIKLENVDFSYEKRPILHDVSVTIPDKCMTAIVGPSGAGKSTICSLIARFWDVDHGRITIGGTDIKDYTLESLMNQISMVFQKVYLFHDTIENNIRFGNPKADRNAVIAAAKKACCHEFIQSLPNGYDTIIGDKGFNLSGGEQQRISIARAILKDSPIIIFDEATANVDPENEALLQEAIEALTKNKTIIMIAHRLKTIRNAKQILVINNQKIEQKGTHEELVAREGIYKDFVTARMDAENWEINK